MRFQKVSYNQYEKANDGLECFNEWNDIPLPKRATSGSAGYDFYSPIDFELKPNQTIKIATGIRIILDSDKFLACYPRSGLGFKYRMQLNNTIGVIDSDYSQSDNEGHIFAKITNDTNLGDDFTIKIKKGDAFLQGVIQQFFKVEDDNVSTKRNGGFSSTDNKN